MEPQPAGPGMENRERFRDLDTVARTSVPLPPESGGHGIALDRARPDV